MTKSNAHYAPWERNEIGDSDVTDALDKATKPQLEGFVSELLSISERRDSSQQTQDSSED